MPKTSLIVVISAILFGAGFANGESKAHKKRILRVALIFDLSGRREPALDVVKGIEGATEVLNASGDVEVILKKYNSGSDAAGTRLATLQVLKDTPDLVIAEIDSSKAVIAAQMLEQGKRVMITPYATSPAVTEGSKFVFRTCFDDRFQGQRLAGFAMDRLKAKTAAIFSDGGELYSQTLAKAFRSAFEAAGGRIVRDEKILPSSVSFKEQLDAANMSHADLIFLPVYEQTAARFINESIQRADARYTFLGGDGWGATRPFKDVVFRPTTTVSGYWVSHYSGDFADSHLKMVDVQFKKFAGVNLNASSAIGYDTMMIAAKALSTVSSDKISQTDLANALRAMPAYAGLTGTIHYHGNQDPEKSLFIRKINRDKMGFETELKP